MICAAVLIDSRATADRTDLPTTLARKIAENARLQKRDRAGFVDMSA
jgi:hypothetical protein